ncbi:MAG: PqqD family protein [Candidatus Gygaella obscura]|nr:PqqD family protein [Candidatus Gygaella obscura]
MNSKVFNKNKKIVARDFKKETILVPIFSDSDEASCIYSLNFSAGRVWQLINGKRSVKGIKKIILQEFDVNSKGFEKQFNQIIKELKEIKAIK